MDQKSRIKLLKGVIKGIAKVMGENTEVVLHDLEEKKIVSIENSYITGRSAGYQTNDSVYKAIVSLCDEDGHLVGYNSQSRKGSTLRSSHFLIKDNKNCPKILICINQDVSAIRVLRDELDALLVSKRLIAKDDDDNEGEKDSIQKITTQLILEEIERVKPTSLDAKEVKMTILQSLQNRGVFSVKDAVPRVCELLSISQATLYVYLREIRNRDTNKADAQEK
jgi:predicted transcriptional regulator YheO